MALSHWGFIYMADGCDPDRDVSIIETDASRTVLVGIGRHDQLMEAAVRLVADGAQLVELCGAFGPTWTARVIEAVGGAVPVGAVGYGPEAVDQLHAIFS
jgi:hypothetical protein